MTEVKLGSSIKKSRKINVKLPEERYSALKAKIKEHGLTGLQALFDAVIVGGVVMRRPESIDLIRKHKHKYKEIFKQESLARLGKVEAPIRAKERIVPCFMYNQDFKALNDFVIEENIKRQWIFMCLFIDSFLDGDEEGIKTLIKRHKDLSVGKRKAAIARLSNDKFIKTLPMEDAESILVQMTKEYDEKKFDASLSELINFSIEAKKKAQEKNEEAEEDEEFNRKIRSIEFSKVHDVTRATKIVDDVD
jgi:hypothetical protein